MKPVNMSIKTTVKGAELRANTTLASFSFLLLFLLTMFSYYLPNYVNHKVFVIHNIV